MGWIVLYTYDLPGFPLPRYRTVSRGDTDVSLLDFVDMDGGGHSSQPPDGTVIGFACQPGTNDQYTYKVSSSGSPYATYDILRNSTMCGYVPPACDIAEKTFTKTDQTQIGVNDGTANLFCTSSFGPIIYALYNHATFLTENSTGYFTGLAPDTYHISAVDANFCEFTQDFQIFAFDPSANTHFKYRLQFTDVNNVNQWELRLLDMRNLYDRTLYPKDIIGATASPVIIATANQDEDKTSWIIPTTLDAKLWYDGLTFTPDEFSKVPEKSWKVELYKNSSMYFQGWLLPDQTQDYYANIPYEINIQATDGLPSLKGNIWGNGTGGQGYSTFQIQQYGLATWISLVRECLYQLQYPFGQTVLISSLQFNSTFTNDLWLNISTWSDILYDTNGVAVDTYTALNNLLGAFKLSIFQHNGSFVLINWNDMYYLNKGLSYSTFLQATYLFNNLMNVIINPSTTLPIMQNIGFTDLNKPYNPPQSLNWDKAYNIQVDIQFNVLALGYENPSFELSAVEGSLPLGFQKVGVINAFCHQLPDASNPNLYAYDGNWVLRFNSFISASSTPVSYIDLITPIPINQNGMAVNISFYWRPVFFSVNMNTTPAFTLLFIGATGNKWYYNGVGVNKWLLNPPLIPIDSPTTSNSRITDYTTWNLFSETTASLPEDGNGTLNIRMYAGSYTDYTPRPIGADINLDIDMLNITFSSTGSVGNIQNAESHYETAVTGVPLADLKNVPLTLFTYPANKRMAGNVFTLDDFDFGQVANLWNFALKNNDPVDRLPATVSRAIARNYSRQMRIWEGDVKTNAIQFFGMFILKFYEDAIFMPWSISVDCKMGTAHVILVECDDSDAQFIYNYVAIFANNARITTSRIG